MHTAPSKRSLSRALLAAAAVFFGACSGGSTGTDGGFIPSGTTGSSGSSGDAGPGAGGDAGPGDAGPGDAGSTPAQLGKPGVYTFHYVGTNGESTCGGVSVDVDLTFTITLTPCAGYNWVGWNIAEAGTITRGTNASSGAAACHTPKVVQVSDTTEYNHPLSDLSSILAYGSGNYLPPDQVEHSEYQFTGSIVTNDAGVTTLEGTMDYWSPYLEQVNGVAFGKNTVEFPATFTATGAIPDASSCY